MSESPPIVSSLRLGLLVVLFLMPFVNVSCSGMMNIPLSGFDLAVGETIEIKEPFSGRIQQEEFKANPYATLALALAALGVVVGFTRLRPARVANTLLSASAAVSLLLLKSSLDREVMREGQGLVSVSYEFAFWAALTLFVLDSVVNLYFYSLKSNTP